MAISAKRFLPGGAGIFVGLVFLAIAVSRVQNAIRNIEEFSYCAFGYLGFVCAAAFGETGLCGILSELILLRCVPRWRRGHVKSKIIEVLPVRCVPA